MRRKLLISTALLLVLILTAVAQNTAVFPGLIAGNSVLYVASNGYSSTLTLGINSTATTLTVPSTSGFTAPGLVSVNNEIIAVCSVASGTALTVGVSACPNADGRGFDGTTAVSHLAAQVVQGRVVAWSHNQLAAEVMAIEGALGVNLANVPIPATLFAVDKTGTNDSTAGLVSAASTAKAAGVALHIPGGVYKVSVTSGPSLQITGNQTIYGDGWGETKILQYSNSGTTLGIMGEHNVVRDLMIAKGTSATGGVGIDVGWATSTTNEPIHNVIENVRVYAANCNEVTPAGCDTTANANRLTYGIRIRSDANYDTKYNHIHQVGVRWAGECLRLDSNSGAHATNANYITDNFFDSCTIGLHLASSGENHVNGNVFNGTNTGAILVDGTGGAAFASSGNYFAGNDGGEANGYRYSFSSATHDNTIVCASASCGEGVSDASGGANSWLAPDKFMAQLDSSGNPHVGTGLATSGGLGGHIAPGAWNWRLTGTLKMPWFGTVSDYTRANAVFWLAPFGSYTDPQSSEVFPPGLNIGNGPTAIATNSPLMALWPNETAFATGDGGYRIMANGNTHAVAGDFYCNTPDSSAAQSCWIGVNTNISSGDTTTWVAQFGLNGRPGGMRLNSDPGESCTSAVRGTFNVVYSANGTKDVVQVCAKGADDAYAWRPIY